MITPLGGTRLDSERSAKRLQLLENKQHLEAGECEGVSMSDEKDLGGVSPTAGDTGPCLVPADSASHVAHTPGPWHLRTANGKLPDVREIKRPHGEASHYRAVVGSGDTLSGSIVASLDFGYGRSEDAANAHLIAAAPELLEALKGVMNWLVSQRDYELGNAYPEEYEAVDKARAIVAKAEGR